jgi:MraZ protein
MFTGEFPNSLDEKGRLTLPVKLRSEIEGTGLILTKGPDTCLWLFKPEDWREFSDKLRSAMSAMSSSFFISSRDREVYRRIIAPAQPVEVDKIGRIPVPPSLREYAHLIKDALILGIEKFIEIWDEHTYRAHSLERAGVVAEALEELSKRVSF